MSLPNICEFSYIRIYRNISTVPTSTARGILGRWMDACGITPPPQENIPNTRQFKKSVGDVSEIFFGVDGWRELGRTGHFMWSFIGSGCPRGWIGGQRFKQYLVEGTFWHGDGDRENVVIRARVKYDPSNYQDDVPFWQRWFRLA